MLSEDSHKYDLQLDGVDERNDKGKKVQKGRVPFHEYEAGQRPLGYDGGHAGSDIWSDSDGGPNDWRVRRGLRLD